MDIKAADRFGGKRIHHWMGPSSSSSFSTGASSGDRYSKVCFHWWAGSCNRHPCPYLHSKIPNSLDGDASSKRAHHQSPSQGHVWRNPNTAAAAAAGNGGPQSKWGKGSVGPAGGPARPQVNMICNHFVAGNCTFGKKCKFLHSWFVGDSFSLLTPLQGHQKARSFLNFDFFLLFFWYFLNSKISCILILVGYYGHCSAVGLGARTILSEFRIARLANVLALLIWEAKLVACSARGRGFLSELLMLSRLGIHKQEPS